MKKYSPHISTLFLTFVLVFAVSGFVFPQTARAEIPPGGCPTGQKPSEPNVDGERWCVTANPPAQGAIMKNVVQPLIDKGTDILLAPLGWLAILILQIASLFTYLGGVILNFVVQWTVVEMAQHLKEIGTIDTAWKTIRDVANIGFIFVLLYAAIRTILGIGSDTKKLIVNIVVVAILINFSLFFTKVVIDASNILAVTFYDAIAPNALPSSSSPSLGLSNSLMEPLQITSLWKANQINFDGKKMIIVGVMGTIVSLIAAFVFFAVAIMLVIRFVVLIFVLILSPLAFMGFILPQLKQYKDQWQEALLGQAFFAPIYFMLTWIVIIVSRGLLKSTQGFMAGGDMAKAFIGAAGADGNFVENPPLSSIAILVNFIIMIVFLIASLIIAKKWADKAGHGVPGLTKWATGFAGGATLGMAGRLGRNTVGAGASRLTQSEGFQRWAGRSLVGQTLFKGTQKAASSSFDLRATKAGGAALSQTDAGQAKLGGFDAKVQEKTAARDKFAQTLRGQAVRNAAGVVTAPSAKEAYAARISGNLLTRGGTRSSTRTIFGTMGRHNRVAASKILNDQLDPLETQEQNLQNREPQLIQQLANMNNELTTINAAVTAAGGVATPQQTARLNALNDHATAGAPPVPTNRNSIDFVQYQLNTTQANLARITAEVTRIRGIINTNQLTNPNSPIVNPVTGGTRDTRADEQNY